MSVTIDSPASAGATIVVSDAAGLSAALAAATGGETILLAPGTYSGFSLRGRDWPDTVTVASQDPEDRAVFDTPITLRSVTNLRIEGLDIGAGGPSTATKTWVYVDGADRLTLHDVRVEGGIYGGEGPHSAEALAADPLLGQPRDYGIMLRNTTDLKIEDSEFTALYKGVASGTAEGLTITGSEFHHLRSDGITIGTSTNVLIEGNYFHDFFPWVHPVTKVGDHPDFIQFRAFADDTGITGLTIRDNVFLQGEGGVIQSIFGHASGGALAGPLRDFVITGNFIQTNHSAGISLGDVIGALIADNVLIPTGLPAGSAETGWRPTISLTGKEGTGAPADIEIRDNILTLSWRPSFDPTGFGAAGNEARDITIEGVVALDRGKVVPAWWTEVTLPDLEAFTDLASWKAAAFEAIRAVAPAEVAALLPAPTGFLLVATEESGRLEGGAGDDTLVGGAGLDYVGGEGADRFVVDAAGPGGGSVALDLAGGDTFRFGEQEVSAVSDLLLLALEGRLTLAGTGELRLATAEGGGFALDLGAPASDLSGLLPEAVTLAGDPEATVRLAPGLEGYAMLDDRILVIRDGAVELPDGLAAGMFDLRVAAADGQGGFAFGTVALTLRPDAPVIAGGEGADRLAGTHGVDVILGGGGADFIFAHRGDDWLEGGAGNDNLAGVAGSDMLIGGAGADRFTFTAPTLTDGERDVVADLDFAEGDWLFLSGFDASAAAAGAGDGFALDPTTRVRTLDQLLALDEAAGVTVERTGAAELSIAFAGGGTIAIALEGASAERLAELASVW